VDSAGNLFIADYGYNLIWKLDTNGNLSTAAGNGSYGSSGDGGVATNAGIYRPFSLAFDSAGNLYIAESGSARIRQVDTNGIITTVAGTNVTGFSGDGGPAVNAWLNSPSGIALDSTGNLFVADQLASRVRAQRVAVFLDTCFSGAAAGSGGTKSVSSAMNFKPVSTSTLDRMSEGAGRIILAASQANQESLESSSIGHGYFTYYVLQGLQQSKGMDPMGKLYLYVRDQVSERANQKQVPVMSQSDQGDQVLRGRGLARTRT
jgi:hypothetical protein